MSISCVFVRLAKKPIITHISVQEMIGTYMVTFLPGIQTCPLGPSSLGSNGPLGPALWAQMALWALALWARVAFWALALWGQVEF